jgi:hypothetical protein
MGDFPKKPGDRKMLAAVEQPSLVDMRPTSAFIDSEEIEGIRIAVQSVFKKLAKLQGRMRPIYEEFGFRIPSAGVAARDLSERIEQAIVQHCESFTKGRGHCDLARGKEDWEVKVCQSSGLTINQSKVISGENYLVVNYDGDTSQVRRIWVLWRAEDRFFTPRRHNSNARAICWRDAQATGRIDVLYEA